MIFAISLIWGQIITEGFESGMPTSYTTGSAILGSGTWTGTEFIRGTTKHSGSYSCQLRSTTGSEITTPNIATGGVGTVTLWAAKSTSGTGPALQIRISVDGGEFTQVGTTLSLSQNVFNEFSVDVDNSNSNIKIQFYRTSGTVYIDDVVITEYSQPDIIISEIMQNPNAVNDTDGEWFEIYNAGSTTVNIDGWTITDLGSDNHTIDNGGTINIDAGSFLVLGIDSNSGTNGGYTCNYEYTGINLSNSDDELILKNGSGTEIDRAEWDGGPNWPNPTGASMVFTGTPSTDNNVGSNWTTANARELSYTGEGDNGSPGTNGNQQTLPITLSTFTAQYLNSKPTLYWKTQSEEDNMGWFIYRNTTEDFTSAEKITGMIEGHGTTTQPQSYIYEDVAELHVEQTYYYWLASVDYSGTIHHYDRVAQITIPHPDEPGQNVTPPVAYDISADPNPFSHTTNISFVMDKASKVDVAIYNIKGELVKSFSSVMTTSENEIVNFHWNGKDNSGKALSNGVYLYSVKVNGKDYATKQLILMK